MSTPPRPYSGIEPPWPGERFRIEFNKTFDCDVQNGDLRDVLREMTEIMIKYNETKGDQTK